MHFFQTSIMCQTPSISLKIFKTIPFTKYNSYSIVCRVRNKKEKTNCMPLFLDKQPGCNIVIRIFPDIESLWGAGEKTVNFLVEDSTFLTWKLFFMIRFNDIVFARKLSGELSFITLHYEFIPLLLMLPLIIWFRWWLSDTFVFDISKKSQGDVKKCKAFCNNLNIWVWIVRLSRGVS